MTPLSTQRLADLSGGRLSQGDPQTMVSAVSTDTRSIPQGALFVALVGDRFDGHDFLTDAVTSGARALMVSRSLADISLPNDTPVIQVADTLTGLQELARGYRREELTAKAVVITGSNGKTSTKDMIRGVLGSRHRIAATQGNLNNHIGLPLSILRTEADDAFAIWEIGMNHPGEIAPLAAIASPDLAVITNIGTAHIGNMGSRAAIAQEKGALAEALGPEGVLVLNANDDFSSTISQRTSGRVVTAGIDAGDIQATDLQMQEDGITFTLRSETKATSVRLPVPGVHMVSNATLAAAVGQECGLSLDEIGHALSTVSLTPGRLQTLHHGGVRLINDAYNANPDSMRASLTTVGAMEVAGRKFAVLGGMGELGSESDRAHREIGEVAVAQGFDHICSVNEEARGFTDQLVTASGQAAHHFHDHEEAAAFLKQHAKPGDLVLLKGSRAAAMDSIYNLFAAKTA